MGLGLKAYDLTDLSGCATNKPVSNKPVKNLTPSQTIPCHTLPGLGDISETESEHKTARRVRSCEERLG